MLDTATFIDDLFILYFRLVYFKTSYELGLPLPHVFQAKSTSRFPLSHKTFHVQEKKLVVGQTLHLICKTSRFCIHQQQTLRTQGLQQHKTNDVSSFIQLDLVCKSDIRYETTKATFPRHKHDTIFRIIIRCSFSALFIDREPVK